MTIIVCVAWCVVWVGSRRNLVACAVTGMVCSMAVGVAAGLACDALGVPRYPWQAPFLVIIPLPVLGGLMVRAAQGDPVTVVGVVEALADWTTRRRRRWALRGAVSRRVRAYQVEVRS